MKRKSCHKCNKLNTKKPNTNTFVCMVCDRCHSITYCGQECQEEDWPRHQVNCVPVRVAMVDKENGITGLVASKNFKKWETIYTETALIENDMDDSRSFERNLKKKVKKLSEEQKSQFYKLKVSADHEDLYGEEYSSECKIFMSNSYGNSLFLNTSQLNLCFKGEPNADRFVDDEDESKLSLKIVATKDISKGEEIKIVNPKSKFYCPEFIPRLDPLDEQTLNAYYEKKEKEQKRKNKPLQVMAPTACLPSACLLPCNCSS